MESKRLAIFDLGNVLYRFSFDNAFQYWAEKSGKNFEEISGLFRQDDMYQLHEINKISIGQYKTHVCEMLGIDISLQDFIIGWNSIFMEEIKGAQVLLETIKKKMTVVALSNTNEIHCSYMHKKYWNLFRLFDKMYFSHEIQARKPDSESFNMVLSDLQVAKDEAVFFDDVIENIRGAERIGIESIHVKCTDEIDKGMRQYFVR
jgi:putative hydrolase of the HAD superfamily